ncbi:3'-5' exonuclease [Nocardiopsis sp. NPDC057823]|uniref:3'-5' exonuclease n=1 Tax=Nocardiopsis sp. NPDC057823 TaxID=3346256 RepID=UPI00366DCB9D
MTAVPVDPVPLRPVGATRTAAALAARTGWPVRAGHVPLLVEQGHLSVADHYEGRALYDRDQAAAIPERVVAALPGMPETPPGPAIEDFTDHLRHGYGLEVTTTYRPRAGRWHLDWPVRADGHPDPAGLREDLAAHPAGAYRRLVDLATPAHRAIAAARRALAPGAALVLDVETTGLGSQAVVVEIAAIAADTGAVLLDTLVRPGGVPVEAGAQRVHGITPDELAGAPAWAEVWSRLSEIADGRLLVAYNADFDRRLIAQTCRRHGIQRPRWEWACAMAWRGAAARTSRPGPLGGAHRALGDARAARDVVRTVADTAYTVEG